MCDLSRTPLRLLLYSFGFAVISALEIPEHLRGPAQLLHNTCRDETGVDEDLIAESRNGYLPDQERLKCYIHCLFDKSGLIDENGNLLLGNIMHMLPTEAKEILDGMLSKCSTMHGDNPCETAWLTVKCYFEADPETLTDSMDFRVLLAVHLPNMVERWMIGKQRSHGFTLIMNIEQHISNNINNQITSNSIATALIIVLQQIHTERH